MKKWTYLVATLFFGATVAFTSCVNTDEPEGIKEMRGAKAELLRAKALVEQAKATSEAAQATLTQAQAEVQKAIAEVQKAQAEAQRAQTQIDKDKAAVELQKLQAEAEAKIAEYEADAAAQQLAYEKTMRDLEALALTLTTKEQKAIKSWQDFADAANDKLQDAEDALKTAQGDYYDAVINDSYISESVQEAKVAKAQLKADQKAKAYAIQEGLLASLKETAPAEWDQVLRDLKDSIYAAEVAVQETKVAVSEYYRSEEFQAYEQAVLAAIEAQGQFEGVAGKFKNNGDYVKAKQETVEKAEPTGTYAALKAARKAYKEAANAPIALEPYRFDVNPAVAYFLNHGTPNSGIANSFVIGEGTWSLGTYLEDVEALAEDETHTGNDKMFKKLQKLMKYRDALDEFEIDPNGQEWLRLDLPAKEEASLKADSIYDAAVAKWQIEADIVADGNYSGVAIADSAKALKELIDGQNAAYTAYAAGVAEYDSLIKDLADTVKAMREPVIKARKAADKRAALLNSFLSYGYKELKARNDDDSKWYSPNNWNEDAKRKSLTNREDKDSLSMVRFLQVNHDRDSILYNKANGCKTPEEVLAFAKAQVDSWFSEVKVSQLMDAWDEYPPIYYQEESGAEKPVVGDYNKKANAVVEAALADEDSYVAKTNKRIWALSDALTQTTGDESLLKAYQDFDRDAIYAAFKDFSKNLKDDYALMTVDTLKDNADSFNFLVGYDQWAEASTDNSFTVDSVVAIPGVQTAPGFNIVKAVKKSISDEAFTTMTTVTIDEAAAKDLLTEYSNDAFGSKYDWESDKARLINEIEDKLLADCKEVGNPTEKTEADYADYGAFGAKYYNNYMFEVYSNYQEAADLKKVDVDSLDAQIARMQAAVEAAKVPYEPLQAALDSAKAVNKAAKEAITAAEAERDAQMDAQEELVTLAKANVKEWKYQEANLAGAIEKIADGEETVEAYLNAEELDLAKFKVQLEEANEAVVEAQKVLEMIKAGTYSYEFAVQQAESALERAQANYDIAAVEYQAALAKLAEVLATLVGE